MSASSQWTWYRCSLHTVITLQVIWIVFLCASPHQDDVKGEEDMAAKKAALLEKRLRREKEALEKKQQQELDQEQKKEAARSVWSLFIPVCWCSHIHVINKSLCRSPPSGWKPRRSSRRRMRRRRGGIISGMSIWGRSSSSWWWTWTRSSSLGPAVSRRSRGPSPSTGTWWSRLHRLWERQVSDIHGSHTHRQCLTAICSTSPCFFALQVCVLEASQYQAFLWRLSTWPTTTESNQITRRTTGETRSLPVEWVLDQSEM